MSDQRPYATLLAKGEDRRERILAVAQRLLVRNGWRNTTLGHIAREAGLSSAGLLHHFQSKEQLLHAVLETRDAYDKARWEPEGDIIEQIEGLAERFNEVPDLIGTYIVLLIDNLASDAPLHDRLRGRYHSAVRTVADGIRRGQRAGQFRADIDPVVKATEVVAFLNGMETSWLLDPSISLTMVFKEYTSSLARQLTGSESVR